MRTLLPVVLAAGLLLTACGEEEPETRHVSHYGSVEVTFHTEHLNDTQDVIVTQKNIYDMKGQKRTLTETDTVPGLGTTLITGENDEGETQSAPHRRDYDFFVTIK